MTYLTRAPDPKGFRGVSKATHFRSWPSQIRRSCFSGPESNEVEEQNSDQPERDVAAVKDKKTGRRIINIQVTLYTAGN